MVEKLKLVWKITQLRLILKSLIFAGLLFWVKASQFGIWQILLFTAVGFALYFRNHSQNNWENIYSFLVLFLVSMLGLASLGHIQFILPAIIFFSALFYLILGIKEFYFIRRSRFNSIKNILLIFSVFIVYFMANKFAFFYLKYLAVFLVIFLLIREWLFWLEPNFPKRYNLVSFVSAFVVLQCLWAVSLLPLGFLNSASLMTVLIYVLSNTCTDYFKGTLDRNKIVKNFIILIISVALIFFFTNWSV